MERRRFLAAIGAAAVLAAGCAPLQGKQKQQVVLQISDDNVKTWQTAFNVVNNLTNTYGKGNVDIELVAFGAPSTRSPSTPRLRAASRAPWARAPRSSPARTP